MHASVFTYKCANETPQSSAPQNTDALICSERLFSHGIAWLLDAVNNKLAIERHCHSAAWIYLLYYRGLLWGRAMRALLIRPLLISLAFNILRTCVYC
jgi:hypothetical protein